ncbi:unnamed protein product [Prorocentrum cordatum]|uniref:Uncharacterized protein n=1 Tax=Prorocentrum cordatum TaxID=2364126 RepID=A0ABN9W319_9DINO|nr:unnamed protein product [Polarella glacialis]
MRARPAVPRAAARAPSQMGPPAACRVVAAARALANSVEVQGCELAGAAREMREKFTGQQSLYGVVTFFKHKVMCDRRRCHLCIAISGNNLRRPLRLWRP